MIDPLETAIVYLMQDGALKELVGDRIAAKHRYGDSSPAMAGHGAKGWAVGASGLAVRVDGGTPDIYAELQEVRLDARCYADSAANAMKVWRRLVEISRETDRVEVETQSGTALLHSLLQESGPSTLYDNTIGMDFVLAFFSVTVGEEAIE